MKIEAEEIQKVLTLLEEGVLIKQTFWGKDIVLKVQLEKLSEQSQVVLEDYVKKDIIQNPPNKRVVTNVYLAKIVGWLLHNLFTIKICKEGGEELYTWKE